MTDHEFQNEVKIFSNTVNASILVVLCVVDNVAHFVRLEGSDSEVLTLLNLGVFSVMSGKKEYAPTSCVEF